MSGEAVSCEQQCLKSNSLPHNCSEPPWHIQKHGPKFWYGNSTQTQYTLLADCRLASVGHSHLPLLDGYRICSEDNGSSAKSARASTCGEPLSGCLVVSRTRLLAQVKEEWLKAKSAFVKPSLSPLPHPAIDLKQEGNELTAALRAVRVSIVQCWRHFDTLSCPFGSTRVSCGMIAS